MITQFVSAVAVASPQELAQAWLAVISQCIVLGALWNVGSAKR